MVEMPFPIYFMEENTQKIDITKIILVAIIGILLIGGYSLWRTTKTEHIAELQQSVNYKNALLSKMKIYKDTNGLIWAERNSLQVSLFQLRADSALLTTQKKELLKRIIVTGDEKDIIAAALIETKLKNESIHVVKPTFSTDSSITFSNKTDTISFNAIVTNVHAIPHRIPSFHLDSLTMSNKTFIDFKWGTRKNGFPISFSVTNSNPIFKTVNIESYIIPEITKTALRPTLFEKIGTGVKTHGFAFGIGAVVGFTGATYLLTR